MTRRLFEIALVDEIRAELARQHLSTAWLATETGLPDRAIRRRLAGSVDLKTGELDLIASVLGVDVGVLNARAHAALEAAVRRHPAGRAVG